MQDTVLIFGAGAVGRGLLGELAGRSGLVPVFVEACPETVKALEASAEYTVRLCGRIEEEHTIREFDVLHANQSARIDNAVYRAALAATAVGGTQVPKLAPLLAGGLRKRDRSLNILICENAPGADRALTTALLREGCENGSFSCVPCSVERMAKCSRPGLDVVAEGGQSVYVDATRWQGPRPHIPGLLFRADLPACYERKLYTNNAGHALLAYLGYLAGCRLLHEALAMPRIRAELDRLLMVSSAGLVRKRSFTEEEMRSHVEDLVNWRFANRALADTVKRVARNPLRKLGPDERLAGLAGFLHDQRLDCAPVCRVIAAAMHYRDPEDPGSIQLARMIADGGPEAVLSRVCGFPPEDPRHRNAFTAYHTLSTPAGAECTVVRGRTDDAC